MVNPIAKSYWRLIKAGRKEYNVVPNNVKEDVLTLAMQDIDNGVITKEQYKEITGEEYK